ncbi:tellurite resistance TerB family protein [Ferrimonas senticii]|uniref:tellurite resistance TerB family protein n=1 Tax=Ferrimonas senticii TaxID=394566 RepID=UPI0004144B31|nr:tellurite resistance TerB family protein [Ferrimonas senticii]
MDFQGLLNQVLGASQNSTPNQTVQGHPQSAPSANSSISPALTGLASGALGGTLMGMLMGSKKGRKMGKGAAKIGGAAALGALALKAYQSWQQNQTATSAPATTATSPQTTTVNASAAQLPPLDDGHSKLLLKAMIGAAKADGHVDEQERARLQQAISQSGASASVSQFVETELSKPLDPSEIAAGVNSPELAAEIYLASVLMVDEQNFMEKSYLQELARQLNISPELAQQLEQQLGD